MVSLFLLLGAVIWSYIVDLFAALHELASASSRTLLKLASSVRALLKPYGDTLRWLTTVLMEYKSTIFNSFEKGFKVFFPSLFNACLSLLPFYVKFEQLNVNKWPK